MHHDDNLNDLRTQCVGRRTSSVVAATLAGAVGILVSGNLYGQQSPGSQSDSATRKELKQTITDSQIELLRLDMRSKRKQVIAANLPLTDDEAVKFWPVYDQYSAEMAKLNDSRFALIKEYAANYRTMTDEQASEFIRKWVEADKSMIDLRLKYIPLVEKVLSEKKSAMFFQIDRRVQLMIELQLASWIPMITP